MDHTDTTAMVVEPEQQHSQKGLFSLDPGLAIWTWVVFGLLFLVLRKYAWSPLMASVQDRERAMTESLKNAERLKTELSSLSQKQKEMLDEAQETARNIVERGRQAAEKVAREITERSRQESSEEFAQAKQRIVLEKKKLSEELRNEAIDLIINASEHLMQTDLDEEKHHRIVKKYLEKL